VKWPGGAHRATAPGGFSTVGFFLILGIVAAYFITYGPYVADYSRYLPENTSVASTFWYTYVGMSLSGIWLMILGAAVQIAYSQLGIVEALAAGAGLGGGWLRVLALLVLLIGLVNIGALNIYGAAMSLLTIATSFMKSWKPTRALRLAFMIPVAVIATIGSVAVSGDLINTYENFIFFLIAFLIPWSAVNLVDFYFVRKGRYHVGDLFTAKGRYRSVSWAGVAAYLIGCAVMIPFISTTFYTGPLAAALGFDISWMVGLVVSGAVYALFARIARVRESDAAAAALDPKEAAETAAALAAAGASDDNKPHTSAKGI
jgi:nucleobase:cation symporter-1, NCS1 family